MAEIHDFEKERDQRMVAQMMKEVHNWGGFKIDLDISKLPITFTGHGYGNKGKPEKTRVRIIAYDTSGPTVQAFGAIRMTGAQWEEFKKLGDGLLEAIEHVPE
jgi:hypothetical protein